MVPLALFDGFVNPGLAIGVLLAGVPILIHLLNRGRHKPLPWAAMRFVLAAYKKTRRRVQLENLLLLLLRTAAIAFLALAVARPFSGERSPLAALAESRRDLLVVIDASASTGYREGTQTVFEGEVERARELLHELKGEEDRARLVLAGEGARLLSWTTASQALSLLETLKEPGAERLDLGALLAEVLEFAEEESAGTGASAIEVHLLTDLQRGSFQTGTEGRRIEGAGPAEMLDRLDELGVRILVEDFGRGGPTPRNLGIEALDTIGPLLGPDSPTEVRVAVRNFGSEGRAQVRVALEVNGVRQPTQSINVDARASAEAVFPISFDTAGFHSLLAEIEGDRLALDDERPAVIHVPGAVDILVVNGSPSGDIERDAVGFLMAALEPLDEDEFSQGRLFSPFRARELRIGELEGEQAALAEADVIWLADLPALSEELLAQLERRVAEGASLIVSLGPRVNAEAYGDGFFRADGTGLLPAEIGPHRAVAARGETYWRVADFDERHPALAFFNDDRWRQLLTEVPVYEFLSVEPAPKARVLARLDDRDAHPLLVEGSWGEGRVLLFTTTISPAWTLLPSSPRTLIPFLHELLRYAGRREIPSRNIGPGDSIALEVESFPRSLGLRPPGGAAARPLAGEAVEVPGARWRLPTIEGGETQQTGLYLVQTETDKLPFAVQLESAEGDLARLAPEELEALHPVLVAHDPRAEGSSEGEEQEDRGELWRSLMFAVAIALVAESLWAAWIGHSRRSLR